MGTTAILTGTGLLNEDGSSRSRAIRRHCEIGRELELRRDESPLAESSGVAVFVRVPRFFGLLGHSHRKIAQGKGASRRFVGSWRFRRSTSRKGSVAISAGW